MQRTREEEEEGEEEELDAAVSGVVVQQLIRQTALHSHELQYREALHGEERRRRDQLLAAILHDVADLSRSLPNGSYQTLHPTSVRGESPMGGGRGFSLSTPGPGLRPSASPYPVAGLSSFLPSPDDLLLITPRGEPEEST
mmetsp:Transcript_24462/g.58260  ORF Transcript_24462/g.58260 Transcript_24462/m.58260 type:complete len:141 (+) Transcript_24462:66-488(+)